MTVWNPDDVIVRWVAPDNGGSPITSYTIFLRESDAATYTEEQVNCDGTDPTIRDATECTIPVTALKAAPFSLAWGTNVHAKIVATNLYGSSAQSDAGFGAIITTNPDPPINLTEDYA